MKTYLAAEGGGSKTLIVLYDETGHVFGTSKMCGTNTRYHPAEEIEKEFRLSFRQLIPSDLKFLDRVDCSLVGGSDIFFRVLEEFVNIGAKSIYPEGNTALAATGKLYGIVAQCGTGSDAFFIQKDKNYTIGGWGPYFGDEGSGYDIGIQAVKCAIYGEDGRGPKTILSGMLKKHFNVETLWDIVIKNTSNPKLRQDIAELTKLVTKAAEENDNVAIKILEKAAHNMSWQVLTAIHRNNDSWEGPIVVSGGVWKGSHILFDTFCKDIKSVFPEALIVFPKFEPVVGCIVLGLLEEGFTQKEITEKLENNFSKLKIHEELK